MSLEAAEAYVSIDEACRLFSISRRTFYRLTANQSLNLEDGSTVIRIPPVTGRRRVLPSAFRKRLEEAQE